MTQAAEISPRSTDARFVYRPTLPAIGHGWWMLLRVALTLLGALVMILGAFADWFSEVPGVDLTYERYAEDVFGADIAAPPEALNGTLGSLGLVAIVLGVFALLGLATKTGRLTRVAAGLALLSMAAFVITASDADTSLGSGALVVAVGAILALVGGLAGSASRT